MSPIHVCLVVAVIAALLPLSPTGTLASTTDLAWEFSEGFTSVMPDPGNCVFDDHLGRSPRNAAADPAYQYEYRGTLRDNQGNPIQDFPAANVELTIWLPCQNPVVLHPDGPSNFNGQLLWGPETLAQGGGSCAAPGIVEVTVVGLTFKTLDSVASPDEDGDGRIAVNDLQIWQQAFVSQAPLHQGDLDLDEAIALSDLALWQVHFVAP